MDTHDRAAGTPPVDRVKDVRLDWNGDDPLVAVVQLNSLPAKDYVSCRYRLRDLDHPGGLASRTAAFERAVELRLDALEQQLAADGGRAHLDFLILPEVFVSRAFAKDVIIPFCSRTNAIAICGVDYPDGPDEVNCNSAWIMNGAGFFQSYEKITRSQYDARDARDGLMPMRRGDTLYRFINERHQAFGVLICYDFSHFDLVHRINLDRRDQPLDALFVIAHNPFGDLYRTCCVADSHRFYQHVILCNVASYGGSGVFAPVRTEGARQTLMAAGLRNETIALTRLELNAQREAREKTDAEIHSDAKERGTMMRRPGIYSRRLRAERSPVGRRPPGSDHR